MNNKFSGRKRKRRKPTPQPPRYYSGKMIIVGGAKIVLNATVVKY